MNVISIDERNPELKWFYDEIGKAAKKFKYNDFVPTKDPFIGRPFLFSI